MSKYAKQPLDFAGLKTIRLRERGGKVKTADFARPFTGRARASQGSLGFAAAYSGGRLLSRRGGRAGRRRARKGRAIVWGLGGHVIKCGLAPVLIDLMRRGYATAFALNGSASIHDFEIALAGHTSEDVEAVLPDGRFGAAEETGREMNRAIAGGDRGRLRHGRGSGPLAGHRRDSRPPVACCCRHIAHARL